MTRPRWNPEKVAELKRRHEVDGETLQALADEHYISRQAMWTALNWDAERVRRMLYQRRVAAARKAAKLAKTHS